MKKIILLACLAVLPNGAAALDQSDLLGKWTCHMPEETEDGLTTSMTADVEFENTGRFSARMTLNFKDPELEATAKVKYRSNWAFKDGYLYDRPKSAVVRSLRVNGRDMRRSRFARDIRANLLEHSLNDKVKVTFASETKMSLTSKGSTTHCVR